MISGSLLGGQIASKAIIAPAVEIRVGTTITRATANRRVPTLVAPTSSLERGRRLGDSKANVNHCPALSVSMHTATCSPLDLLRVFDGDSGERRG